MVARSDAAASLVLLIVGEIRFEYNLTVIEPYFTVGSHCEKAWSSAAVVFESPEFDCRCRDSKTKAGAHAPQPQAFSPRSHPVLEKRYQAA